VYAILSILTYGNSNAANVLLIQTCLLGKKSYSTKVAGRLCSLFLWWVPWSTTTNSREVQKVPQLSAKELEFIFGHLWLDDLSAQ